jgi:poly-gamma-glutamate synthesis protein (capsule biosynthesis protein)
LTAEGVPSDLPVAPPVAPTATTASPPPPSTGAGTSPDPTTGTTRSRAAPPITPPATPTETPPGFESSVNEIDAATAARMTASWRPGCPVPQRDLRLVTITHWGFDGRPRPGELVVHVTHAEGIRRVFAELFAARFPIDQVRLVDEFGGDDDRSMAANNTSGFNCRRVSGSSSWSEHAFGRAIDLNPLRNPYVTRGGRVSPPAGRPYANRARRAAGMIRANDVVVRAFAAAGWRWGGYWSRSKDYQHFSSTGR